MGRVELFWLPLGADGNPVVRWSGRIYESLVARRDRRAPRPLFHSALLVHVDGDASYAIEMAPVWSTRAPDRGVVAEGPVGHPWLGRSRMFRYEVRCWRDGVIPDLHAAVGGALTWPGTEVDLRRLLDLVPSCPTPTWGLDELETGDMWNSNSVIAWLLVRGSLPTDGLTPPNHGRAPGWAAGIDVARRTPAPSPGEERNDDDPAREREARPVRHGLDPPGRGGGDLGGERGRRHRNA